MDGFSAGLVDDENIFLVRNDQLSRFYNELKRDRIQGLTGSISSVCSGRLSLLGLKIHSSKTYSAAAWTQRKCQQHQRHDTALHHRKPLVHFSVLKPKPSTELMGWAMDRVMVTVAVVYLINWTKENGTGSEARATKTLPQRGDPSL